MLICTPVQEPALFFSFPILPFCFVVVVRCMRVQRERERGGKKIQACVRSCIEAPAWWTFLLAASTHFSRALYLANALVPAQSHWSQRSHGD